MRRNDQLWETIGILMNDSFWGQYSTVNKLITNLQSEVDEFIDACKDNNSSNAWEEASDVLMILLCILFKYHDNDKHNPDELADRIVEKLHWRYADLYRNKLSESEENEENQWKDKKVIEHRISTMFCPNKNCQDYLKIDNNNIAFLENSFICKTCGKVINPSKKNTLFSNYKQSSEILSDICKAAVSYSKGNHNVADALFKDNQRVFRALSAYLDLCEDGAVTLDYKKIFSEYIHRKFNVEEQTTLSFLDEVISIKNSTNQQNSLVEQYCSLIKQEKYSAKNMFSVREWDSIKNSLKETTFDVTKKIEKAINFSARSWDNQVTQKYLLECPAKNGKSIIECMSIFHYKGPSIRDLTIEVSNMYNCIVGCGFCASGALSGDVVILEPMDYVRQINTCIKESGIDPADFENFFVSFAGIGEPSFVYKNIAGGMVMIRDIYPNVKFNIATFGYDLNCFSYWNDCKLPIRTLQIPLYHTDREKLKSIVTNLPADYDLVDVLKNAVSYQKENPDCRIKLNYIPMKGKNDSEEEVNSFVNSLMPYRKEIIVKVAFLNYTRPAEENGYVCPGEAYLNWIASVFEKSGFTCYPFGTETNTLLGCGQLAQNSISESIN